MLIQCKRSRKFLRLRSFQQLLSMSFLMHHLMRLLGLLVLQEAQPGRFKPPLQAGVPRQVLRHHFAEPTPRIEDDSANTGNQREQNIIRRKMRERISKGTDQRQRRHFHRHQEVFQQYAKQCAHFSLFFTKTAKIIPKKWRLYCTFLINGVFLCHN